MMILKIAKYIFETLFCQRIAECTLSYIILKLRHDTFNFKVLQFYGTRMKCNLMYDRRKNTAFSERIFKELKIFK
jgi:hypothetical protein